MAADLAVVSRRCMADLSEQFLTCLSGSAQKTSLKEEKRLPLFRQVIPGEKT